MKSLFLSLLGLLIFTSFNQNNVQKSAFFHENDNYLTLEEKEDGSYKVIGLNDSSLSEYRIYHEYEGNITISEIGDNVFSETTQNIIVMVSNGITSISSSVFNINNLVQINFTGSEVEWTSYNLSVSKPVYYYENDEGFINYWNINIRPTADFDVCDIGRENFLILKSKYDALGAKDKLYVDDYLDASGNKIGKTMSYLSKYFEENKSNSGGANSFLSQDVTLGLIVSIAIFGMTTISIFYLLKKKEIIS